MPKFHFISFHFGREMNINEYQGSVVQIPMSTHLPMGSGGGRVSMDSAGSIVSVDEEEKDEDEELAHDDDEEDEDEINHTHLPKEVVHAPSPSRRVQNAPVWKHT